MQKGWVIQNMRYRSLSILLLVMIIAAGCGNSEDASALAESSVALTSDTAEQKDETTDEIQETPALNDDGSYTYSFEFKDEYISTDFAGIDVLDATEDYPRERFEDVFMYSKGAYLDKPDVPADFFDEWGYTCPENCDSSNDPGFGFSISYIKNIDGKVSCILSDINYCIAVRWEKDQILYNLWDKELSRIKSERKNIIIQNTDTKEILAHNDLMGADARELMDDFHEGLYDFVLSKLPEGKNSYSPLFRFDNGVFRALNVDDDGYGFEFMLPDKGRRVYAIYVDKPTGRISGTLYRTPYPGEDFYAYPAGRTIEDIDSDMNNDPFAEYPVFEPNEELNPEKEDTEESEAAKTSEESTEEASSVAPAEEKKEEPAKEAPAATGAVIDEEEFRRGVMMGPKKGTIVNDDFATGVTNSLISQLNGMGAIQTSDPAPLIFRSKPFRFETTPEEAANAMINDVMPNFGFDMAGKNYFISAVQKFDNGYVVTVGWTRWN
ncbi:hypothetical protein [Butyrivibrio proteoclasticus]|uniref:hypothetical protein n=1 Tax=Butyrivibrio proteoclasticus TaxID=43305 RepID=UPI001A9A53BF|nr:hypothetical protein [Butyrivibrio proteoclasticus]